MVEWITFFPGRTDLFGHQSRYQIIIVSYAAYLGLGHRKLKERRAVIPFNAMFFCGHTICSGAILFFKLVPLYWSTWLDLDASGYAKSAIYSSGIVLLALACAPIQEWVGTIRDTGPLWLYASLTGVAAWGVGFPIRLLWAASRVLPSHILQMITFNSVMPVLRLFLPNIAADPAAWTIGTPHFSIMIAGSCSGIEGLGLVFVFCTAWLWFFRDEFRFPRALLLIPCALGCIWILNILRICALIIIGNDISSEVAIVGFHSLTGWIAFTIVSLAFSLATRRISWVRKLPTSVVCLSGLLPKLGVLSAAGVSANFRRSRSESPVTRAFLLPFLAILAASFVSKTASGYFEWLYPLRFVAAVIAICFFWPELKRLNWNFGWVGPFLGVMVFLVWIAPTWWTHQNTPNPLGLALAELSPAARWCWIAFRVAAAVVTVPIAEELAFRGYVARRLMDREFDSVPFTSLTALSVGLSSFAFGLMHGQHWIVGTLAGLAYASAVRWRGRIGDAIVAHAVSNLLLAAWALSFRDWTQW